MGRTPVRRVEAPRSRRTLNGLVLAAAVLVLLFAVVGVASAGKYAADKLSSATKTPTPQTVPGTVDTGAVTRARAQATALVKAARASEKSILANARSKANRQASRIIASARKHASTTGGNTTTAPTNSNNGTGAVAVAPTPTAVSVIGQSTTGGATTGQAAVGSSGVVATPVLANTPVGSPDLSNVPATWLVVGYNATFGAGPGSAGSVSVVNRSGKSFSGTVKVTYAHGGVAYAPFSNLAPGVSTVLALNGPAYPGGGFTISVVV